VELGLGIHGEQGLERTKLQTGDAHVVFIDFVVVVVNLWCCKVVIVVIIVIVA
jgi:dihydroxyacetone kinase